MGSTEGSLPEQRSAGGFDAFVRQYDAAGEELWVKPFGTEDTDLAFSVAVDQTGHPYVAGSTKGTLPGQTSHGERDAYLIRFASTSQAANDQGRQDNK